MLQNIIELCAAVVSCAYVPRREDITLAAVDFHVAPGLTQHLAAQPQVKAAARGLAATNAAGEARTQDGTRHWIVSCAGCGPPGGAGWDRCTGMRTYICHQHRLSWTVACCMDMQVVLLRP